MIQLLSFGCSFSSFNLAEVDLWESDWRKIYSIVYFDQSIQIHAPLITSQCRCFVECDTYRFQRSPSHSWPHHSVQKPFEFVYSLLFHSFLYCCGGQARETSSICQLAVSHLIFCFRLFHSRTVNSLSHGISFSEFIKFRKQQCPDTCGDENNRNSKQKTIQFLDSR